MSNLLAHDVAMGNRVMHVEVLGPHSLVRALHRLLVLREALKPKVLLIPVLNSASDGVDVLVCIFVNGRRTLRSLMHLCEVVHRSGLILHWRFTKVNGASHQFVPCLQRPRFFETTPVTL